MKNNSFFSRVFISGLTIQGFVPYIAIIIVIALSTFVYITWEKQNGEATGVPNETVSVDKTRQSELDELYASEALPDLVEGGDLYNYGLTESSNKNIPSEGYLVLSGVRVDFGEEIKSYALDINKSSEEIAPLLPGYSGDSFVEFKDKKNPSDLFLFIASPVKDIPIVNPIQLLDTVTKKLSPIMSATGIGKQNLAFSKENNLLAYKRFTADYKSYTDLIPIKNWEVVVIDTVNDTFLKKIEAATQPVWSPDGTKLVILKNDGLFVHDIATDLETRAVKVADGQIIATSMFNISPDGKYMAWTTAKAGVITISEITSWEPFVLKELGRIHTENTEFYWPEFSPDGNYYSVQAIDAAQEGEKVRRNPRIEIRATLDRDVLATFPLDQFDFNALFTDTWVDKLPAAL